MLTYQDQQFFYHYIGESEIFIENNSKKIDKLMKKENIRFSGVFHYDEQFPKVNGEQKVRLILMDAKYKIIINQKIIPQENFNKKFIEEFLIKNTSGIEVKDIVTDGDTSYPEIIDKIAVFHQQCHFHKMQNLMNPVNKKKEQKQ
jgi:transposase-like protein